jgi:hypothetical protein
VKCVDLIFPLAARSLHLSYPDVRAIKSKYLSNKNHVAWDFAYGLRKLRRLTLHGAFLEKRHIGCNDSTWTLLSRFSARCKDITHLVLSAEHGYLDFDNMFKELDFPRLKTLSLIGIGSWKERTIDLKVKTQYLLTTLPRRKPH